MTVVSIGRSGSTSTSVTANGSAHTKGAWAVLTASLSIDAEWIGLDFTGLAIGNVGLLDIGTGAESSESVVIPNLLIPNTRGTNQFMTRLWIPMAFASGTRIVARIQDDSGGNSIQVGALLGTEGFTQNVTSVAALGITTASTTGSAVDPGGAADTKGAYTQITASTAADYDAFMVCATHDNAATTDADFLVDMSTGPATESVVIPDIPFTTYDSPDQTTSCYSTIVQHSVSSGTRLTLRAQCSITDATDRVLNNCAIYGMVLGDAPVGGSTIVVNTNQPYIDGYPSVGTSGRIR